nr:ubiquitin carboxyl-terminal hydrolase 26 [Tanacetum cinerariifolium]
MNNVISLRSPHTFRHDHLHYHHVNNNIRQQKQSLVSLFHLHQTSFFICLPFNIKNNPTTTTTLSSVSSSSSSVLDNDDPSSLNLLSCSSDADNDEVRIVAVLGEGAISPLKSASWTNVLLHTTDRLKWVDENNEMLVFTDNVLESNAAIQKELTSASILLIVSVMKQDSVEWIQRYSQNIPSIELACCGRSKPAYDQFPCQYQLFYWGKAKGSFWYEPVFQVKTLDGKLVWRRRKYRVKRGKVAVALQELRDSLIHTTTTKKITSAFYFPGEVDMARWLSEQSKSELAYDLSAVLIHKGSTVNGGQYVAHIKDQDTWLWWEFDDDVVTELGHHPFGGNHIDVSEPEAAVNGNC